MTDQGSGGGWDPIVTPWHLDEYIPAFPVPATLTSASGAAACLACAWLPGRSATKPHKAIIRLAGALGANLELS